MGRGRSLEGRTGILELLLSDIFLSSCNGMICCFSFMCLEFRAIRGRCSWNWRGTVSGKLPFNTVVFVAGKWMRMGRFYATLNRTRLFHGCIAILSCVKNEKHGVSYGKDSNRNQKTNHRCLYKEDAFIVVFLLAVLYRRKLANPLPIIIRSAVVLGSIAV